MRFTFRITRTAGHLASVLAAFALVISTFVTTVFAQTQAVTADETNTTQPTSISAAAYTLSKDDNDTLMWSLFSHLYTQCAWSGTGQTEITISGCEDPPDLSVRYPDGFPSGQQLVVRIFPLEGPPINQRFLAGDPRLGQLQYTDFQEVILSIRPIDQSGFMWTEDEVWTWCRACKQVVSGPDGAELFPGDDGAAVQIPKEALRGQRLQVQVHPLNAPWQLLDLTAEGFSTPKTYGVIVKRVP